MTEAAEKLSGKLGVDTTDFKSGIAAANRELRVLESGFRANAAALGDWTKDASGLETRIKSLTDQIDIQRLKVEALREEYERVAQEKGENSRAAQDLQIKLNKETETLNKMESELKGTEQALTDLGNAEEDAGDEAEEAGGKMETFKSIVSGIGPIVKGAITVVAGLAVAVVGVGTAIGGMVFSTASASAELVDLSAKTGISTTRLQELSYVGDQVGSSQDSITTSLARLVRTMGTAQEQFDDYNDKQSEASNNSIEVREAQIKALETQEAYNEALRKYGEGSTEAEKASLAYAKAQRSLQEVLAGAEIELGDSAAAFKRLGVSITDEQGNLRDNEDVFADLIDALGRIDNEAERDALSMSLFGKSAQELNPLIKAGSDEMARLAEEAHKVGAVMSEEDVAAFEAFDDTLASLQAGLKGTLGTLAGAFLPGFQDMFNQAGGYLQEFSNIVKSSDGDFGALATGLGGLVTQIVSDLASQAPQLLQTGVTILQAIIGAIITALPTLIPAALEILQTLVQAIVTALPTLIPAAINVLLTLVTFILQNLPMLIDAGLKAIISLAQGLAQALPQLIPAVVQAIITIVQTLVDNVPLLIDAALQLILGLATGLIQALPVLIAALPQIITAILNALIDAQPMILDAAGELIGMLATGIVAAIPVLILAISELIVRLGDTLTRYIKTMPNLGKNFVEGLGRGIKNATGFLYDAVKSLITGMIATIQDLLGIHSPSDVGIGFGENLVGSVGLGGEREAPSASRQLASAAQRLVDGLTQGTGGGGSLTPAMAGVGGGSLSVGDIYVDARGATDPKAVGQAVQDSLLKALRSMGGA